MSTSMTHENTQNISEITQPRMTTWGRLTDNPVGLAITDPRGWFAWKLNALGMSIARLSTRILDDCPSSLDESWQEGVEYGRTHPRRLTREDAEGMLRRLGFEPSDKNMGALGFAPKAVTA